MTLPTSFKTLVFFLSDHSNNQVPTRIILDTKRFQTVLHLIPPLRSFILSLPPRTNLDNRPQVRNPILHSPLQRRSIIWLIKQQLADPSSPASLLEDRSYPLLLRHGARVALPVPQERPGRIPPLGRDDAGELPVENAGNLFAVFVEHDAGHVEILMS